MNMQRCSCVLTHSSQKHYCYSHISKICFFKAYKLFTKKCVFGVDQHGDNLGMSRKITWGEAAYGAGVGIRVVGQ